MDTNQQASRIEANRTLGRKFFAEQDRLRGGPAQDLCGPSYTARIGASTPMDRTGHEGFAKAFYGAFPDIHHEIEQVVADEDSAAVRFVLHGTHTSAFFGIPATQKRITVAGHVILRVKDGRVAELLAVFDEAGLLRQIGALQSG